METFSPCYTELGGDIDVDMVEDDYGIWCHIDEPAISAIAVVGECLTMSYEEMEYYREELKRRLIKEREHRKLAGV